MNRNPLHIDNILNGLMAAGLVVFVAVVGLQAGAGDIASAREQARIARAQAAATHVATATPAPAAGDHATH